MSSPNWLRAAGVFSQLHAGAPKSEEGLRHPGYVHLMADRSFLDKDQAIAVGILNRDRPIAPLHVQP